MRWLVTGGAGHIGSHILRAFDGAGMDVVALDALTSGHRELVPGTMPFVHPDIRDTDTVPQTLCDHDVSGVIHLAGYKYAGESVRNPLLTYEQNVTGTARLYAEIFGTDYDLPDGTCIRDHLHVGDLAAAHVAAAQALESGRTLEQVDDHGSGTGVSVREIMATSARVAGTDFAPGLRDRRPGDPDRIVADGTVAAPVPSTTSTASQNSST